MTLSNLGPHSSQYRRATLALALFALALFLLTGLLAVMEKAGVDGLDAPPRRHHNVPL